MDCHQCHRCDSSPSSRSWWRRWRPAPLESQLRSSEAQIALVGMPNVGKSVLFHALTGVYVTVSNYPGTTVEVSRGLMWVGDRAITAIDTPGMYSAIPMSEEERVARDVLMSEPLAAVVHVVDAKNLGRMLPLAFQLIEAGLPVILAANMMDEAHRLGLDLRTEILAQELGIPVIPMAAALNQGIEELRSAIAQKIPAPSPVTASAV
ncbi:MAG TPA: 50S ribosome-binding GTPase [Oscillatoriales cyanobacterium M59_W2019_021]|nr:MAG: GTP-binding protein [Cyanobacteria bacterium J055]HIK34051.1 50S ribosome-binding GTPase [Oscillatoriales cyanobacterium M4454_W2019_049]HIK53150.1 50S ribosome-binding GTPase [Oscillatoriales cyanobacterium M59_W2019_021]